MAIRVDNLGKKSFINQDPLMPHFPSWWLPSGGKEINFSFSTTKTNNVASESGSPIGGNGSRAKPLGLQLMHHHDSSPTLSVGHSPRPHQDATGAAVVNSQDQSYNSSESGGQDESCGRSIDQGQMKPVLLYSTNTTSENMFSQPDHAHPMVQLPYGLADPYLSGLLTAYGPHSIIQPQMGNQMAPNRVPLPLNLAEDGPIFVNAKQYHGILRRRQSRARLEAQNKLVKTRKPYLHESRHLHALNRVRGTGGRFVSTKKKTQPPNRANFQQPYHGGSGGDNHRFGPTTSCAEIAGGSNGGLMYVSSNRTGSMSSADQRSGGLMFGASGNRSSSVR